MLRCIDSKISNGNNKAASDTKYNIFGKLELAKLRSTISRLIKNKKINKSPFMWSEKTYQHVGNLISEIYLNDNMQLDASHLKKNLESKMEDYYSFDVIVWLGPIDLNESTISLLIQCPQIDMILSDKNTIGSIYSSQCNKRQNSLLIQGQSNESEKLFYCLILASKKRVITNESNPKSESYFNWKKGRTASCNLNVYDVIYPKNNFTYQYFDEERRNIITNKYKN